MARPPATSAMRNVLSAGMTVCGVSSRMAVNATSALKATRPRRAVTVGAGAAANRRSGRHQIVPVSQRLMGRLPRSGPLLPGHADRPVEQRDVLETVVAEPAEDFGIQKLPLIFRRVPVEGIEPAPAPVGLHRDRCRQPDEA